MKSKHLVKPYFCVGVFYLIGRVLPIKEKVIFCRFGLNQLNQFNMSKNFDVSFQPTTLNHFVEFLSCIEKQITNAKNNDLKGLKLQLQNRKEQVFSELEYVHEINYKTYRNITTSYWGKYLGIIKKSPKYPVDMIRGINECEITDNDQYYKFIFEKGKDASRTHFDISSVNTHEFGNYLSCIPKTLIRHLIDIKEVSDLRFIKSFKPIINHPNPTIPDNNYAVLSIIAVGYEGKKGNYRYFDIVEDPNTNLYTRKNLKMPSER